MAAAKGIQPLQELERKFIEIFGTTPDFIVRAPGRVNLIGEHTDYNDGFVFPAAIDRDVRIAGSFRSDRQVCAFALNFNQSSTFPVDGVKVATEGRERWSNYLRAIAWVFAHEGIPTSGINCVVQGEVPLGAGLSSSAAMLVASVLALGAAGKMEIAPVQRALLAQKAERGFVGVNVGIMDQFISSLGRKDHALLIDTRSLEFEAVPLPKSGVVLVIADTNKKRGLVDSAYNTRRSECEQAVKILQNNLPNIKALRDVTTDDFNRYSDRLPEVIRKRARHVVTEDTRTLESVPALKAGDIKRFGVLMNESHESLKNDYEVSCKELDALVEAARSTQGVFGARMTGAGFGGCTISLVAENAVPTFLRDVPVAYKKATGINTTIYVTTASQGAERIK